MAHLRLLSDWYLDHGDYLNAVQAYEDLFAQDPSLMLPQLRFAYGKALFAVDRDRDALAQLEIALAGLGPARAEAALYIGEILARQGDCEQAESYFALVRQIDPQLWSQNEPALRKQGLLENPGQTGK